MAPCTLATYMHASVLYEARMGARVRAVTTLA